MRKNITSLVLAGLAGAALTLLLTKRLPAAHKVSGDFPNLQKHQSAAAFVRGWNSGDNFFIAEIQKLLGVMADGVVGVRTVDALRSLQARVGLPVTGTLDLATAQYMIDSGG